MKKTALYTLDNSINFTVPFAKVSVENRTVSGFASLDNLDKQGHIVPIEASREAFAKWRRNIREMHSPKAVGKALEIREEEYFDPESGDTYKGMWIKVRVSEGAEDTWKKVLDGTLSGFSIGGSIVKQEQVYDIKANSLITVIKDFELVEVSLVDSPANPLANILSISKNDDGTLKYEGMATEFETENVMFCAPCDVAKVTDVDETICPTCEDAMENVGWVETNTTSKSDKIKEILEPLRKALTNESTDVDNTGGETNMSKVEKTVEAEAVVEVTEDEETVTKAEEVVEAVTDAVTEEVTEEVVEKADEAEENGVTLADLAKRVDELAEVVKGFKVQDKKQPVRKEDDAVVEAEAEATVTAEASVEADVVAKALNDVVASVSELTKSIGELDARVSSVEASGAVKKSAEVTELKKADTGTWNGALSPFASVNDLD